MTGTSTLRRWFQAAILVSLFGCDVGKEAGDALEATAQVSASEWQTFAQKRVVFGHQSVGKNILDGVESLAAEAGVTLPIVQSRDPGAQAGIAHFFVGENGDPPSKLIDFSTTLGNGAAHNADIALLKLCYLDFNGDSDAIAAAKQYIATFDRLSQEFPNVAFVAVTAPLTIAQSGPKAWIKRLLGRTPSGYADNARRQEFNELLRAHYGPRGRLFDLARIEAVDAGDFEYEGKPIEVLNSAWTYDDGHLNARAERIVAARLISYLAALHQ